MSDEAGEIQCNLLLLDLLEPFCQGEVRAAILSDNGGGDSLSDLGLRLRHLQDAAIGMAMGINKARCDHHPVRRNDLFPGLRLQRADLRDLISHDAYIRCTRFCSRTIHQDPTFDQVGSWPLLSPGDTSRKHQANKD